VTGDFAAHVFPGQRDPKTQRLSFLPEQSRPASLDIRRARANWPTDDEGVQDDSSYYREFVRMRFWKHGANATVPLSIICSFGSTQVHYRWEGKRLVPALVQLGALPVRPR